MKLTIISCNTLHQHVNQPGTLLLDLREKEEFDTNHYPGAYLVNPNHLEDELEVILEHYPHIVDTIILYCDRGNVSLAAARILTRLGYPVVSLGGGFDECSLDQPAKE